jgi:hypothetical protein
MREDDSPWRVRVAGADGRIAGAGILVAAGKILTCAHVVTAAAGPGSPPDGGVLVDFPGLPHTRARSPEPAAVLSWWPDEDCALLGAHGEAPDGVVPAVIRARALQRARPVRAFGHPRRFADGVWSRGQLVGRGGPNPSWVQFDAQDAVGRPIEPGFSGAGVIDDDGSVLGMVTAVDNTGDARVAWMTPAEKLLELLGRDNVTISAPSRARPHHEVGFDVKMALVDALYAVPVMRSPENRQQILQTLPVNVSSAIHRSAQAKMDLFNAVQTCLDHEGSLTALVNAVRAFESDSTPVRELIMLIGDLGLDGA